MTLAERLLARVANRPGRLPDYIGARCLRRRFLRSTCDRCASECPVQALYPGESVVRLDGERCTGCMACTAVCPTEALVGRDPRPARAAERIFARGAAGPVALGCERAVRDGTELLLPCLGILSLEELAVFAVTAGQLTLLLHPCRDCGLTGVPELIRRRVDRLAELWHGQAAPPAIELRFTAASPAAEAAAAPGPDRRDFFRAFKALSVQAAAETWVALKPESGRPEEQWASTKHLPVRVSLLHRALQKAEADRQAPLLALVSVVEVGESCTFCRACVGLCPSGAISSEVEDQAGSRLLFDWSRCSGCGLCLEFCPARAITIGRGAAPADIAEQSREIFRRRPGTGR